MPERPFAVEWARQSAGASQDPADGSRLIDCYAVNPAALPTAPFQPKVPVVVSPAPSLSEWLALPAAGDFEFRRGGRTVAPAAAVNGLAAIDHPSYGRRLVGVCAGYWFFEIPFDGQAGNPDPGYDGRGALHRQAFDAARFQRYTSDAEEEAGTGPLRLASDGRRVVFAETENVYAYDSADGSFHAVRAPAPDDATALADEDWVDCDWVEGYFVLVARGGQVFHSNLHSLRFDQLDFASAETNSDENVAVRGFRRSLFVFGTRTVERWVNTGRAAFAFERDNSFVVNVGCASRHAVAHNDRALYWLGGDGIVYMLGASEAVRVSHEGVEREAKRTDLAAAKAFTYTEEGHKFYSLTLSDGTNWTLDTTTGFWHERSRSNVNAAVRFDRDTDEVVGTNDSLSLHVLSAAPFRDPARVRFTVISPKLFFKTLRTQVHSLEVQTSIKPGQAAPDGDITLSMSHTATHTWEPPAGQAKPLEASPRFNRLGSDRDGIGIQFRLEVDYQPVAGEDPLQVLGAYATASAGVS